MGSRPSGGKASNSTCSCKLGCKGIVAKRIDRPYRSGRCKSRLKVKESEEPCCDARVFVLNSLIFGGRRINGAA